MACITESEIERLRKVCMSRPDMCLAQTRLPETWAAAGLKDTSLRCEVKLIQREGCSAESSSLRQSSSLWPASASASACACACASSSTA